MLYSPFERIYKKPYVRKGADKIAKKGAYHSFEKKYSILETS